MVVYALMPVMLAVTLTAAYLIALLLPGTSVSRKMLQRLAVVRIFIFMMLLMYPGLARQFFTTMRCSDVPGAGLVLSQDYSVRCFADGHWIYVVSAIIAIALYILGFPLILFAYLWRNRKHLHDKTSPNRI